MMRRAARCPWNLINAGVQYWLGWQSVLAPWRQLSSERIALAVLLVLLSYVIRTVRLVAFFGAQLGGRFSVALRLTLIHNLWNNLLPTLGELSFPILMRRYFAISATRSLPALLWFRFLDLYAIVLLAVLSLVRHEDSWWLAALLIALMTLAIPLLYRWLPTSVILGAQIYRRIEGEA
jgi:hypothetical protein